MQALHHSHQNYHQNHPWTANIELQQDQLMYNKYHRRQCFQENKILKIMRTCSLFFSVVGSLLAGIVDFAGCKALEGILNIAQQKSDQE